MTSLNTDASEDGIWVMPDNLTVYFSSNRPGAYGEGEYDIYRATRSDPLAEFKNVTFLDDPVNTFLSEQSPTLSADGLIMYYYSLDEGGQRDIYISKRKSPSSEFPDGHSVPVINSVRHNNQEFGDEGDPFLTSDGKELYFASNRNGSWDLFVAQVDSFGNALAPVEIESLNGPGDEAAPVVSSNGLEMYFMKGKKDEGADIWLARRSSLNNYEFKVVGLGLVPNINDPDPKAIDYPEALSPDGCTLYFGSKRMNRLNDLYKATKP